VSATPLDLARAINEAWCQGRAAEALPELFTEEAVIVGPDLSRLAEDRDACVASYVEFANEIDVIEFDEFDHRVDAYGPAAVVDYAYRAVYRRDGEELTDYGRDVIVAVETPSGWQVAWRMARPDL
jgi:hypothetical protein